LKAKEFTRKIFEHIKSNWYMPIKSMYSYSEQEQKVGTWIGGYPVYEKTLFGITPSETTPAGSTPTGGQISHLPIDSPIDNVISIEALVRRSGGVWSPMPVVNDTLSYFGKVNVLDNTSTDNPNSVTCIIGANELVSLPIMVTVRYTKVGDLPDTDKVPVNPLIEYSFKEQIIGYWVNRKPLYKKTIEIGELPNNSAKTVPHGVSDLEFVSTICGTAKRPGSNVVYIPLPFADSGTNAASIKIYCDNQNITVQTSSNRSDMSGYVTMSYTKTTDY